MSPKHHLAAPPADIMEGDINLNSSPASTSCYIDLTYSQFKKYRELIKDGKEKLREEVYKDQNKFDVRRVLFGDDEIRRGLVKDRHEAIEYLERKFGTNYSESDRVRPPTATYTLLVREKSPATLRREKKKLREWNKQQTIARREQKLAELRRQVHENSDSPRYFGASDEAAHAVDSTDDQDDMYESYRSTKQSFLSQITPKTGRHQSSPECNSRTSKPRRKIHHLPPIDLNLRRLTIRIPSIFPRQVLEPVQEEAQSPKTELPPLFLPEFTGVSSVSFQYPSHGKKAVRITEDWVAMKERRRASPAPDESDQPTTVDKWRLLSTANIQDHPPSLNVFVSYPRDGKVQIKRRKIKKKS